MTDIEQKALALVNEVRRERGFDPDHYLDRDVIVVEEALCRAIEQHEAFRKEVSDAVVAAKAYYEVPMYDLSAFIIAKPDPLVEAWQIAFPGNHIEDARDECAKISAAIEKRGGRIIFDGSGA
jgi:hypothetical protein